jgi:D-methionine transport system permease protein
MHNLAASWFPGMEKLWPFLWQALGETLIMVAIAGFFAALIGVPIGILLYVSQKGHMMSNPLLYSILSKIINTMRSIPFVILIASIPWLVRAIVGTTIGLKGAIVPLIIASFPFMAKQTELALQRIDPGVIEAYQAMGFSNLQIIFKVLLKDGLPGIIHAITIMLVSLVSFSAVAGSVGGGGLGDFAIRYGYNQYKADAMLVTISIILVIVFVIQAAGDRLARYAAHEG